MATTKSKTTAEIAEEYNSIARQLGEKTVRRFADRKTANRRLQAILSRARPAKREAPRAAEWRDRVGATRGLSFDLPGSKKKTPPREGTMRAVLLSKLEAAGKKGVAFEALHKAAGFCNRASTRDAIRLLAVNNGYGVVAEGDTVRLK